MLLHRIKYTKGNIQCMPALNEEVDASVGTVRQNQSCKFCVASTEILSVCVKECKRIGRESIKNGREGRVGVFTHRWPLGGGILIVHCSLLLSPAGITHLGPKHYLIVSTSFFLSPLCVCVAKKFGRNRFNHDTKRLQVIKFFPFRRSQLKNCTVKN